jgi:predicted AlkP superfamily phosphohydrolase/phosphomutase
VNVFISVIQTIDFLQHVAWRALSDSALRTQPPYRKLWSKIERCIVDVDRAIGQRLDWVTEDTTLLLVSDHGFQAVTSWFHLNRWLQQSGWLHLEQSASAPGRGLLARTGWSARTLKAAIRRLDVLGLRRLIGRRMRSQVAAQLERAMSGAIDWTQTVAYAAPSTNEGIYINVLGRETEGIVDPGSEYHRVRERIMSELASLRDPHTGETVVSAVYRREDLYSGEYLPLMPDILIAFENRPYLIGDSVSAGKAIEPMPEGYVEGRHHPIGVFAAFGANVRRGQTLSEAKIVDVAPTLLYALGLPLPKGLDGQVLEDVFTDEFRRRHPCRFDDSDEAPKVQRRGSDYDEEEELDIRRRLQGLGYVT